MNDVLASPTAFYSGTSSTQDFPVMSYNIKIDSVFSLEVSVNRNILNFSWQNFLGILDIFGWR